MTRNWVLLDPSKYGIKASSGHRMPDGEGTADAPTLRYDPEGGYYYSLGGGWITNGP